MNLCLYPTRMMRPELGLESHAPSMNVGYTVMISILSRDFSSRYTASYLLLAYPDFVKGGIMSFDSSPGCSFVPYAKIFALATLTTRFTPHSIAMSTNCSVASALIFLYESYDPDCTCHGSTVNDEITAPQRVSASVKFPSTSSRFRCSGPE